MDEHPTNITFEEWIRRVFDHPVTDPAWYWDKGIDWWTISAIDEVAYISKAFETANTVLSPFSNAELKQGLIYLISHASEDMFVLLDDSVPWPNRKRCILSFFALFEQVFAVRCSPELSHLEEINNPINEACYMWWDVLPIVGKPNEPHGEDINQTFLDVMTMTLTLDSDACRESALHGLGIWRHRYPERVIATIDQFLAYNRSLRSELKAYALAQRGHNDS